MKQVTRFETLRELAENTSWTKAVIVFTKDSFKKEFSELERSYQISRDSKYFNPEMNGNSLFGNCLDGKDDGVRLDLYIHELPEKGSVWKVEYCFTTNLACPTCGADEPLQALSRKDNKTMICSDCGSKEALEEMLGNL